jgi:hypothetical protein
VAVALGETGGDEVDGEADELQAALSSATQASTLADASGSRLRRVRPRSSSNRIVCIISPFRAS